MYKCVPCKSDHLSSQKVSFSRIFDLRPLSYLALTRTLGNSLCPVKSLLGEGGGGSARFATRLFHSTVK